MSHQTHREPGRCDFPDEALQAWLDGRGEGALETQAHVEKCNTCVARLEAYRHAAAVLRRTLDQATNDVEPLLALQAIRGKIAAADEASWTQRVRRLWQDLWAFHRRAVAGAMVAAGLGALSAPAVVLLLAQDLEGGNQGRAAATAVVLESLEYQGDATAAVFRSNDGATTIIWVEPEQSGTERF